MVRRHIVTVFLALVGVVLVGASYRMLDKNAGLLLLFVYLLIVPFVHEMFVRFGRAIGAV